MTGEDGLTDARVGVTGKRLGFGFSVFTGAGRARITGACRSGRTHNLVLFSVCVVCKDILCVRSGTLVHFGAVVADAPSPLSTPRSAAGQAPLRLGKPEAGRVGSRGGGAQLGGSTVGGTGGLRPEVSTGLELTVGTGRRFERSSGV